MTAGTDCTEADTACRPATRHQPSLVTTTRGLELGLITTLMVVFLVVTLCLSVCGVWCGWLVGGGEGGGERTVQSWPGQASPGQPSRRY